MIEKIIEYSIWNKVFAVLVTGSVIALGVCSIINIPLKKGGSYS